MKKLYIAFFALVCACAANAAYLYWQVDAASTGLSESGGKYYFGNNEVTGARVVAKDNSNRYQLTTESVVSGAALADPVGITTAINSDSLYANLGSYAQSGYTYYIELVSGDTTVAVSSGLSYADNLSNITTTLGGVPMDGGSLAVWNGGSAYAVPEPTGAMLMIFGLAMLGLKRRKV